MEKYKSNENDVGRCCSKDIEKLKKKMPELLKNSVLQEFLTIEEYKNAFYEMFEKGDYERIEKLDKKFKEFYRINRVVRYMTGLIKRYAIDYDKRVKLRNSRYQLIIDKPLTNGRDDSNISLKDMISDEKKEPIDLLIEKEEGEFFDTKDPCLIVALKKLDKKQIKILHLYYEKGYNNKEIGKYFGQTEQNISYWHKKTIKQLQKTCN